MRRTLFLCLSLFLLCQAQGQNYTQRVSVNHGIPYDTQMDLTGQDHLMFQTPSHPAVGDYFGGISWVSGGRRRASIAAVREDADADFVGIAFFTKGTNGPGPMYESMRLTRRGRLGIGTTDPTHMLQVAGSSKWTGNASSSTEINSGPNGQYIRQYANDGSSISWIIRGFVNNGVQANFNSGGINVNGRVRAREVTLTNTGWADHVFSPGYPLMGLQELKRYVEEHGHLPGIPTEQEVAENGVNLGEINVKLLEKIEELTLYMIDQRSVMSDQNERIRELNRKIREMESEAAELNTALMEYHKTTIDQVNKIDNLESELQELKRILKHLL